MTPREQRKADLIAARLRIDEEIRRLDPRALILDMPAPDDIDLPVERARELAIHFVRSGYTHAQAAAALHLPTWAITPLIAPRSAA